MYDERTDLIGHISHFRQSMALHLKNDALMCHMFPSNLGPIALRWFNRLEHVSIHSWDEMAEAFLSWFITNSRRLREVNSLLAMSIRESESLKNYSSKYWELYNEVNGYNEELAVKKFKWGLTPNSKLRQALTRRSARNIQVLMSWIRQYVWVEEDHARTRVHLNLTRPLRRTQQVDPRKVETLLKDQRLPSRSRNLEGIHSIFNEPIY